MNFQGLKVVPTFKTQFQATVVDYHQEWRSLSLEVDEDTVQMWRALETQVPPQPFPWHSALNGTVLRTKTDDRTMFFDKSSSLVVDDPKVGSRVSVILEIKSVYNFKEMAGFTCRVHQLKTLEEPSREWKGESGSGSQKIGKCLI